MKSPITNVRRRTRLGAAIFAVMTIAALAFAISTPLQTPNTAHAQDPTDERPILRSLAVTSTPALPIAENTYGLGEVIKIQATFSESVNVLGNGTPTLAIQVGDNIRDAAYATGSGTDRLVYTYMVQPRERDADGISIPAVTERDDDPVWNQGLKGVASGMPPSPYYSGLGTRSSHKVDGTLSPWVTSIRISSSGSTGGVHTAGDKMTAELTISAAMTYNSAHRYVYHAQIGDEVRSFVVDGGSGTKKITASYTIVAEDLGNEGIHFTGQSSASNGAGWTVAGSRGGGPFPITTGTLPGSRVSGKPYIASIEIVSQPTYGDTYRRGDTLEAEVKFSEPMDNVDGSIINISVDDGPMQIDSQSIITLWHQLPGNANTDTISAKAVITDGDRDDDGISVFRTDDGNNLGEAVPTVHGTENYINNYYADGPVLPDHKINGAARTTVKSVSVTSSPASDDTYDIGEIVTVEIDFGEQIVMAADVPAPALKLDIGGTERTASYTGLSERSGAADSVMKLSYVVQLGDDDNNGITVVENGLINTSGISDLLGNDVNLNFSALSNQSSHKVDTSGPSVRSTRITSDPGSDDTYGIGETVFVSVEFTSDVTVSGSPQITLEFADSDTTGIASYSSTDGALVKFTYTIAEDDETTDGAEVDANSISLNGGSIKDAHDRDADITHSANSFPGHYVDGIRPAIRSGSVSSNGTSVSVRFTETMKIAPLLQWFIDDEDLSATAAQFILSVMNVEVDGTWPTQTDATISGDTITVTMAQAVTSGQSVKVRYDSVYAREAPEILMDRHGNAPSNFSPTAISNGSTVDDATGAHGITMSARELTITEGESDTYTIVLNSEPTGDVTVALTANNPSNVTVSAESLTFTTENWNTAQTVTVSSTTDDNDYGYWVTITHTASGSGYTGQDSIKILMQE